MSVTRMILRNGQSVPGATDLEVAELGVNTVDGKVYVKDEFNRVVPVGNDAYDDSQIVADLAAETQARQDADAALQEAIDNSPGMIISDEEPTDVPDGTLWLESTTAIVWIYDTDKWIQFPAGGYDDTQVKADISANAANIAANTANIAANSTAIGTKLDADTIWTGTQDEYDALTPDANVLYFITA